MCRRLLIENPVWHHKSIDHGITTNNECFDMWTMQYEPVRWDVLLGLDQNCTAA
jgi:hypothetical protein